MMLHMRRSILTDSAGRITFKPQEVGAHVVVCCVPDLFKTTNNMKPIKHLVSVKIDGQVDSRKINIGAVGLQCEGREAILDTVYSSFSYENGETTIVCELAEDRETFDECKYDIRDEDYMSDKLSGTFYIEYDDPDETLQTDSITLVTRYSILTLVRELDRE